MARAPSAPGKTRLAPHMSDARLLALRTALVADTLLAVGELNDVDRFVFYTPDEAAAEMAGIAGGRFTLAPQRGDDLGQRMRSAFEELLFERGYASAMLVGSDIPMLTVTHMAAARDALQARAGLVLGPAEDGGYYLIGMRRLETRLFDAIEWGTARVLSETVRTADRLGLAVVLLDRTYDIDTIEDLRRLDRDLASASPGVAPQTRTWLNSGFAITE
jgi:hypothetical protein